MAKDGLSFWGGECMPKKREDLYKSVFAEDAHTQAHTQVEAQAHTHVVTHTHVEETTQAHTQAKPGILPLPEPRKSHRMDFLTTKDQAEWIEETAKAQGVSQADIIRWAIDQARKKRK